MSKEDIIKTLTEILYIMNVDDGTSFEKEIEAVKAAIEILKDKGDIEE